MAAIAAAAVAASVIAVLRPPPTATSLLLWSLPAVFCGAPFAAASVLMVLVPTRSLGLCLGSSLGLLALAPLLVMSVFSLAFGGFSRDSQGALVLLGLCSSLTLTGTWGWIKLPGSDRRTADWIAAPALALVLAGLVLPSSRWAFDRAQRHGRDLARADAAMAAAMASYAECRRASREACRLPTSPTHQVFAVGPHLACAEPVDQARIGPRAFVVGIDSRLHATPDPFSSPAAARARCVDALPLETQGAQRVLFCAWRQKSASGNWPGSLAELAAAWPGCVPTSAGRLWYSTPEHSVGYFLGLRGAELAVVSRDLRQGRRYADSIGRAFAFDSELPPSAPTGPRVGAIPDRPAPDGLEAGCAANDAVACWALGEDTFDGYRGRTKDRALGREILDRACRLGSGRACYELGSRGRDDPPEGTLPGSEEQLRRTRRSLTDYERACELGDGDGCAEAGRILSRGKSIPADVLERLANRARQGRTRFEPPPPILQDAARSQMLLGKACDLGRDEGCRELARSGADPARVEAPCARGDGESCLLLARGLAGAGAEEHLSRARDLFLLACDFGFPEACLDAARLMPDAAHELAARAGTLSR